LGLAAGGWLIYQINQSFSSSSSNVFAAGASQYDHEMVSQNSPGPKAFGLGNAPQTGNALKGRPTGV